MLLSIMTKAVVEGAARPCDDSLSVPSQEIRQQSAARANRWLRARRFDTSSIRRFFSPRHRAACAPSVRRRIADARH
jgi:hypothetical protein